MTFTETIKSIKEKMNGKEIIFDNGIFRLYNKPEKSRYIVEIENLTNRTILIQGGKSSSIYGEIVLHHNEKCNLRKTYNYTALVAGIFEGTGIWRYTYNSVWDEKKINTKWHKIKSVI